MERVEHKFACIRVWHPMPPVLGTNRHVSSDRFYRTRTNEAVTTWITSSSSWCLRSQTDGDVPATGEGRDWLHASECPQTHGEEETGFMEGKEESGFMHQSVHRHTVRKRLASLHQSVHRHMVRKIIVLCISVSIPTGEGREWLHCNRVHSHRGRKRMALYLSVHTQWGRKRVASLHQRVHRHTVRKRVASLHQRVHRHTVRKRVALCTRVSTDTW